MQTNPSGTTWSRKRRRNSSTVEVHDLHVVPVGVVAPAEADAAIGDGDEPVIGERDAVGGAAEVGEHVVGPAKGGLQ
jgi:hypothetical protein